MSKNRAYCGLKILLVFSLIIFIVLILLELNVMLSFFRKIIMNGLPGSPDGLMDGNNTARVNYLEEESFYVNSSIISMNNSTDKGNKEGAGNHPTDHNESNRSLRELMNYGMNNSNKSNYYYYYEEQMPVVVYAKTDLDNNDNANDDYKYKDDDNQYYEYDYPYNKDVGGTSDEESYSVGEKFTTDESRDNNDNNDNDNDDNYGDDDYYSSPVDNENSGSIMDAKHFQNTAINSKDAVSETVAPYKTDGVLGRSFQANNNDAYYRQWHYVATSPTPSYQTLPSAKVNADAAEQNIRRPWPYGLYSDNRMTTSVGDSSVATLDNYGEVNKVSKIKYGQSVTPEMPLLSVLRTLRDIWELYQSLVSAWNGMVMPKPNLRTAANKRIQNHPKMRVNSRKPATKFNGNSTSNGLAPRYISKDSSSERNYNEEKDLWRKTRHIPDDQEHHLVDKTRYIKGDPLKGYYDFVITEGSYKFWAVFQLGTAILIIYSTFAAIYYSKVNPLTSDYDYADYLGAGRSVSAGNYDFIDDDGSSEPSDTTQATWYSWLPSISPQTLKKILELVDKFPVEDDSYIPPESDNSLRDTRETQEMFM